jgi:hypothetical protein
MLETNGSGSYYQDFSKYLLQSSEKKESPRRAYEYKEWLQDPRSINALKLADLKYSLKLAGVSAFGNKPDLIRRLTQIYEKHSAAIKIQSRFRAYIVIEFERLKGPAYKARHKCVNDTDFHTMDQVDAIPSESFFSYENAGGFIYGFNAFSLMLMFKRNKRIVNPYNREDIPIPVVCRIFSLYKKIEILYPLVFSENRVDNADSMMETLFSVATLSVATVLPSSIDITMNPIVGEMNTYSRAFERIRQLVGGDIEPAWFLDLSATDYDRYYHFYRAWWTQSVSNADKLALCGTLTPFRDEFFQEDVELARCLCFELIETMIYTGDEAHCRMGARQIACLLTLVSVPARLSRPDLFQSLFHFTAPLHYTP